MICIRVLGIAAILSSGVGASEPAQRASDIYARVSADWQAAIQQGLSIDYSEELTFIPREEGSTKWRL